MIRNRLERSILGGDTTKFWFTFGHFGSYRAVHHCFLIVVAARVDELEKWRFNLIILTRCDIKLGQYSSYCSK